MATKKTSAAPRTRTKTGAKPKASAVGQELPLSGPTAAADPLALPVKKPARAAAKTAAPKAASKPAVAAPVVAPAAAPVAAPVAAYKVSVDFDKAGQDAIETYAQCGSIAAEGMASLSNQVFGFTRTSVEAQLALTQALLVATSFEEAIEAQNAFARESVGHATAELAKLAGLSFELSQKLMAPVQARVDEAARTIWEPLAA